MNEWMNEGPRMKYPYFVYTRIPWTKCRINREKPVCRNPARSVQAFRFNFGEWQTVWHRAIACNALAYANECICSTRSDMITVTKAWNQIFYKLFRVNNQDCIDGIHMYFGIKSASDEMSSRQNRFMWSLASDNLILKFLCSVCS